MTVTININGLTLCHRGSGGVTHNTLPDVCKTPDKGIPIPYQNEAYSRDLVSGTTTVFADGGNMIANYGSNFCKSVFDESGSMGGVASGTNKAEADWITHSFDVFFEGKAACRLTDKMFMNHRNTVNMSGEWQLKLPPSLVEKICNAICECSTAKNKITPTATEIGVFSERALGAIRGVSDNSVEPADAPNEIHRRQACFADQFNRSGNPWHGAEPKDPNVLTEVPFKIPNETIFSETGRATFSGGPTAPGSVQRALSVARGNPGTVVIWDMVTLKNGNLPATFDNVDKIVEIKFEGDRLTPNQQLASKDLSVKNKLLVVDESDCQCGESDREFKREANRVIKEIGDSMRKAALLFGPPGLGGVPGGI